MVREFPYNVFNTGGEYVHPAYCNHVVMPADDLESWRCSPDLQGESSYMHRSLVLKLNPVTTVFWTKEVSTNSANSPGLEGSELSGLRNWQIIMSEEVV
jgi:hypothetical protein